LALAVAVTREPDDLIHLAATYLRDWLQADRVGIFAWDESTDSLTSTASAPQELAIPAITVGSGVVGTVFEQRRSVLLDDYPSTPHALPWAVSRGVRAVAAVPLIIANENLGVLVDCRLRRHRYTAEESEMLSLAATLVIAPALAIRSLRRRVREREVATILQSAPASELELASQAPRLGASREQSTRTSPTLTRREREILPLLAGGRTNREIGRDLGLNTGTVRNLVSRLQLKLGAKNRTHAVVLAIEHGLLK
jgi:DNA-binding CsgD family transcriptional regulator/putative methionine-R-sulfoxide reductase with GAF domain